MAKLKGKDLEMSNEIAAVLKKYGYTMNKYNIIGYVDSPEVKLNIGLMKAGESMNSIYAADWKRFHKMCGLKEEWLGQEVKFGNGSFRIDGLNMKKRDKVVSLTRVSDDRSGFMATAEQIIKAMEHSVNKAA